MSGDNDLSSHHNVNRRDFMKLCTALAATMGLSSTAAAEIAKSMSNPQRPPVIWIGAQECTGCTESLLRATHPTIENLILNTISLEYHEVLSAAFGDQAEENKHNAIKQYYGKYVLVVDGSIPLKDNGIYCMVAGRPIVEHIKEAAEGAAAIIAIGSCAAWGGVAAAGPNPTGAVRLQEIIPNKTVINIPGCPPNPHNFLATVANIITYGKAPGLDAKNRPLFAYRRLIHGHCERRPHFDAGRFAKEFGDDGHRQGWCLFHLGCKGPATYGNCSTLEFCDVGGGIWPVGIGHPCYGCNEEGVGFNKGIFEIAKGPHGPGPGGHGQGGKGRSFSNVNGEEGELTPFAEVPNVNVKEGGFVSPSVTAVIGSALGLVAGVSLMTVKNLSRQQSEKTQDSSHTQEK